MKKKILFIEDDMLITKLFNTRLTNEGFEVISAEDGELGWELFNKEQPDLVILDLMIPKSSGLDVLKQIRSQDKKTPVIIYTVLADYKRVKDLKLKGATDYFVKVDTPPEKLVKKIKAYLT
ncbi:response regulator transcription factor [Patescibacteria group bacterium]